MKLKSLLLLIFVALTLIPFTAFGLISMQYFNSQMEKMLESDLSAVTQAQVRSVENFIYERSVGIEYFAELSNFHQLFLNPGSDLAEVMNETLSARVEKNGYVMSVSAVSARFETVASSKPFSMQEISGLKNMDPKYLDGELHFVPVIINDGVKRGERILLAVTGAFEGDELIGYIVEEIGLSFFENVRACVNVFNSGTIYLTDGAGQVITAGSASDSRRGYVLTEEERNNYDTAWEMRNKNDKQGFLRYKARGESYISYYSYFDNLDWKMTTTVNVDKILDTEDSFQRLFTVLTGLLMLQVVLIHLTVSTQIGKPLDDFVETLQKVKETADYTLRIKEHQGREMGMISREINALLENAQINLDAEKIKQESLKEKAETDELTGLYNRRAMEGILTSALEESFAEERTIACMFIDVDDFKAFNTEYGHANGDKVLRFVASILKKHCDLSSRVGGDEFVICLPDIASTKEVAEIARELICELEEGAALEGCAQKIPVRCSIGVVLSSGRQRSCEDIMNLADKAMYDVKNTTKNDFVILE